VDDLVRGQLDHHRLNVAAWTYKFLAKDTRCCLDFLAHGVKILANFSRVLIRRFIQEDAPDVDAVALVILRPSGVDGHIFKDMLDSSFAVLHPYIAHGRHILSGIEQRQLAGIACIRRGWFARPTVWVDDNKEMQIRIIVDAGGGIMLINLGLAAILRTARLTLCAAAPMSSHLMGTCTEVQLR
jgi:hypothetical protein